MALIRKLIRRVKTAQLHEEVDATYSTFRDEQEGQVFQIDSYGSATRKLSGKVSQSIQLNEDAARQLLQLLQETFPGLS